MRIVDLGYEFGANAGDNRYVFWGTLDEPYEDLDPKGEFIVSIGRDGCLRFLGCSTRKRSRSDLKDRLEKHKMVLEIHGCKMYNEHREYTWKRPKILLLYLE